MYEITFLYEMYCSADTVDMMHLYMHIVYYLNPFILLRGTWKSGVSSRRGHKSIQPNMFDIYNLSVLSEPDHNNQ